MKKPYERFQGLWISKTFDPSVVASIRRRTGAGEYAAWVAITGDRSSSTERRLANNRAQIIRTRRATGH